MANTDSRLCVHCFQPLIYIKFSHHWRSVCDNDSCILFREGQGNIPREDNEPQDKPRGLPSARILRLDYEPYKARCRDGYAYGRSLGLTSVQARDFRNKSKKEIEKVAREIVRA
jgi:hypothetical protein